MTDKTEFRQYHLTHGDVIPLLRETSGKEMIMNICRAITPWKHDGKAPEVLFFSSHAEFTLGKCGKDGKVGRIDSIVTLWAPDFHMTNRAYCNVGIEIKCRSSDLVDDTKVVDKYMSSGMCDYYFMVTTTDELALMACCKYAGMDAIGVASLASGRVLKVPVKMNVTPEKRERFKACLENRSHLVKETFQKYYHQDKDYILLIPAAEKQTGPIVRIVGG